MFINLSNHSSDLWSEIQKEAISKYGEIKDIPFPNIPATYTEQEIITLANQYSKKIIDLKADCVMCQGEFTFVYHIVNNLKKSGIKVLAACSERNVLNLENEDGSSCKKVIFKFVKFREYI